MSFIVAGAGSRQYRPSEEIHDAVVARLHIMQRAHGPLTIMSGMAEGWDEYLARTAIQLELPWVAAVPNRGYGEHYWGRNSVTGEDRLEEFTTLLSKAEQVVYVCDGLYENGSHANFVRNEYMVQQSSAFLVYGPSGRGTSHCLSKIRLSRKPYWVMGGE